MNFGYARVSTQDQKLHLQLDALRAAGCTDIFQDTLSGSKADRPGLASLFNKLRKGDTITVWRLDRLSRSLKDLIHVSQDLKARGIGLRSLNESIDTTTPAGKLIFHFFGALAEFEQNLIQERTQVGLKAARARGRLGGRKESLTRKKKAVVVKMYLDGLPIQPICDLAKISRPTMYKYVRQAKKESEDSSKIQAG